MTNKAASLTSKDRILLALDHKEADRIPLDIGGTTVTGIHEDALKRLLAAKGLTASIFFTDTVQQTAVPEAGLPEDVGADARRIGPDRIRGEKKQLVRDAFGVDWEKKPGELYYSQVTWPLKDGDELSDALGRYVFPAPDKAYLAGLAKAGKVTASPLFPVLDRDCAGLMEMSARLRGPEAFYTDFYTDRKGVEALAESLLEYKFAYWESLLDGWDASPAVISEADDFGTDVSLLVSPEFLREIYFPRYRKLFSFLKKRLPKAKIFFHSCGAVRSVIPDFIELGIDILNPVQYSAKDMDLPGLKKDFGKDIVFWGGGIDTKEILPFGKPEKVRDEVKRVIDILAPGGGFVFATIHNIQADVPTANLLALLETLKEYGRYQ